MTEIKRLRRDIAQLERRLHRLDRAALAEQLAKEPPSWAPWRDSELVRRDTKKQLARLRALLRQAVKRGGDKLC